MDDLGERLQRSVANAVSNYMQCENLDNQFSSYMDRDRGNTVVLIHDMDRGTTIIYTIAISKATVHHRTRRSEEAMEKSVLSEPH